MAVKHFVTTKISDANLVAELGSCLEPMEIWWTSAMGFGIIVAVRGT